jgi:5'-3' exonuclease
MGITGFFGFLKRHPKFRRSIEKKLPQVIDSLLVDCNGIFHKAKAEVYPEKGTAPKNSITAEKKHIALIIEEMSKIVNDFKPTRCLVIAPDGGANAGKMQQQKGRRYKSDPSMNPGFDGNSITPGTDFMFKLDDAIREWLKTEKNLPPKVIYSSHLTPGEGEHTLVDVIRKGEVPDDGNVVFYGLDGDLTILTLLSSVENMFLARENMTEILNIRTLRKSVRDELRYPECNENVLILEFTFLIFLIGNDFIHRLPNLYDTPTSIEVLFKTYKKTKLQLMSWDGTIMWENLLIFFKNLEEYKKDGYNMYEYNIRYPLPYPYPEYREATEILDLKGKRVKENFNPSRHTIKFDKEHFAKLWYDKQFKPHTRELREKYADEKYFTSKDVESMCKFYLQVLEWNMQYYLKGNDVASKNLFYPYIYTPLLPSIINYLQYLITENKLSVVKHKIKEEKIDHSVIHQLMLVLPPRSANLIPEPFRTLYNEKLQFVCPKEFITMRPEGTDADHVYHALIPPINPYLVSRVIRESGFVIPEKYKNIEPTVIQKEGFEKAMKRLTFSIPQKILI